MAGLVPALAAQSFTVGGSPWGAAVDGEVVWVSDTSRGTLLEIDAASGALLGELPTGAPDPRDTGLAVDAGQVWVANLGGTVGVIATATRRPVARAETGEGEPAAVALDDRWAWVPTHGPGGGLARLNRGDPERDPLTVTLPESGFAAAVAGDVVWVAGLERRVFAIDAASGAVERTIDVGGSPRGVAVLDGEVWVTLRDERAVLRLDATGDEVARIETAGRPWPIAADGDALWVATLEGALLRIDPARNAVSGRATVAPEPRGIAVAGDAVWVASQTATLTRVPTR